MGGEEGGALTEWLVGIGEWLEGLTIKVIQNLFHRIHREWTLHENIMKWCGKRVEEAGRRLWGTTCFMFLENIYFLVIYFYQRGVAPFRSMVFKADFFLSACLIRAMHHYLIYLNPNGESLLPWTDLLLWPMCETIHLVQIHDGWVKTALKWKCCHLDGISITGCNASYQNDNFQCSQWWNFSSKWRYFRFSASGVDAGHRSGWQRVSLKL